MSPRNSSSQVLMATNPLWLQGIQYCLHRYKNGEHLGRVSSYEHFLPVHYFPQTSHDNKPTLLWYSSHVHSVTCEVLAVAVFVASASGHSVEGTGHDYSYGWLDTYCELSQHYWVGELPSSRVCISSAYGCRVIVHAQ